MNTGRHQSKAPAVVVAYFGAATEHPLIAQTFHPDAGWKRYPYHKRVSGSEVRRLRKAGVTSVALRSGGRLADFAIKELTA